jgi:hypothetical protein
MLRAIHDPAARKEFNVSRTTKIVLGVFAGIAVLIFLCAATFFFSIGGLTYQGMARTMEFDGAQVTSKAAAIADFQLPEGYAPDYSFSAGGFNLVGYDPGDNHSHLILVQAPDWLKLDQADFEKQLRRNFGDMLGWGEKKETTIVDRRTLRVAGEPVEFAISEGVNSDGSEYRSMAGLWEGRNGPVLIYIEEPLSRWNQAEIDAFIASIQ